MLTHNLTPKGMVLGSAAFGRWSGHEGGPLISGISALTKGGPKVGTQLSVKREWALTTQRYLLQTCSWTSASHNYEKSTSITYKPFSLQHFVTAAGTDECTDLLLFRITTHMQYPWVGSLFKKKNKQKTWLSYFLPCRSLFLTEQVMKNWVAGEVILPLQTDWHICGGPMKNNNDSKAPRFTPESGKEQRTPQEGILFTTIS